MRTRTAATFRPYWGRLTYVKGGRSACSTLPFERMTMISVNKRIWMTLLAALLLFSNVANAVQLFVMSGAMMSHSHPASGHHPAHEDVAVSDQEGCCDEEAGPQIPLPVDCCAMSSIDHRSAGPTAIGTIAPLVSIYVATFSYPRPHMGVASVPAEASVRIAGPPLNLLYKNFRI